MLRFRPHIRTSLSCFSIPGHPRPISCPYAFSTCANSDPDSGCVDANACSSTYKSVALSLHQCRLKCQPKVDHHLPSNKHMLNTHPMQQTSVVLQSEVM